MQISHDQAHPMSIDPWFHFIKGAPWQSSVPFPNFQSHRGFHAEGLLENSLDAFREAAKRGALMSECDVRFTKDLVPVVFHDMDLLRIANRPEIVEDLNFRELQKITKVSSLEEMLTAPDLTRYFNVELKTKEIDDTLSIAVAQVVKKVKGAEERIFFSSFNPFALWKLQKLTPQIPRALLATNVTHKDNRWWVKHLLLAPLLKIHMLNLDHAMITEKVAKFWKSRNVKLAAWTVNSPSRIAELRKWGVDSVISDLDPQKFI